MPNLQPLDAIERASVDELQALQLGRLQHSLQYCYDRIPFYKKQFDEADVHPSDVKTLADIAQFPMTNKEDMRQHYPNKLFARPMEDIVRIHASSGTTGKPTIVGYTQKDIDDWTHCMARSIRAAGGDHTSIVHVAYGYGLFTGGLGAHYGAEKLGATVIPASGGMTERQVQIIHDLKPTIIMVTPSYFLNLAEAYVQQGYDPQQWSLQVGIFGAEPWTEAMRETMERTTALKATNIYGLSEIMGPAVAQECLETQDGLTIWEDYFYPEIVDPETLQPLPDGQQGELVITTLCKEGSPLVRYRCRDLTTLLPGTARTMRRMARILGRSDDMLIIRGVNVFPSQIEAHVLEMPELEPIYQVEVSQSGNLNELLVHVELCPNSGGDEAAAGGKLQNSIKNNIGISCRVVFNEHGSIPRSQAKAVRIRK